METGVRAREGLAAPRAESGRRLRRRAGDRSSIEETALAVEGLAAAGGSDVAVARACRWLAEHTSEGTRFDPSPIGLYFAKLWYWDRLYPLIFTVGALGRVRS